jgi:hypothetical protein
MKDFLLLDNNCNCRYGGYRGSNHARNWSANACNHCITPVGVDVLVRAVLRIEAAIEVAARIRIGHHRINSQEAAAVRMFVVSAAVSPSSFKNMARFPLVSWWGNRKCSVYAIPTSDTFRSARFALHALNVLDTCQ